MGVNKLRNVPRPISGVKYETMRMNYFANLGWDDAALEAEMNCQHWLRLFDKNPDLA